MLGMTRKTELRRLRRARDLTLADVRQATGVSEPVLSTVERGIVAPKPEQANALAQFFGKPITVLLGEPSEAA